MSGAENSQNVPQDLVAIFHASFHPTQGNVVDWSLKASDDLNLDHLEFSALPSGLHLVEQDVVYFTKDGQHGVCIFRRRKTTEEGHRGFRLSSLGVLLAKSRRPRPWRHVAALKELTSSIYSRLESSGQLQPTGSDWDPAQAFFEERRIRRVDLGGAGDWRGWTDELDVTKVPSNLLNVPTVHLPHLLRILGPSSLTLFKHILGRQRILVYTLPPVEAAGILCQAAADMCYEAQVSTDEGKLKGRNKDPLSVLGMVTLTDLDRLHAESQTGRGWIACTTDAIFLEKPSYYDLLIDLTTSTPNKATRPTFHASKPVSPPPNNSKASTHRLTTIRFAWSDVKLWNEIERILGLDADQTSHHTCCGPSSSPDSPVKSKFVSSWTDAWRVYEDVCIICAGLWMGTWRGNSTQSYSTANGAENWGAIHLEGDDDLTMSGAYVRNVGMGIEGGPKANSTGGIGNTPSSRSHHRLSSSSKSTSRSGRSRTRQASPARDEFAQQEPRSHHDSQILTTMTILQTFNTHISFQLSVLESFLPKGISNLGYDADHTIYMTPKDILAFELGPLSSFDARYLDWLVAEYGNGNKLIIKRGWRDLFGVIFGYS